jgi:hypothetical protein
MPQLLTTVPSGTNSWAVAHAFTSFSVLQSQGMRFSCLQRLHRILLRVFQVTHFRNSILRGLVDGAAEDDAVHRSHRNAPRNSIVLPPLICMRKRVKSRENIAAVPIACPMPPANLECLRISTLRQRLELGPQPPMELGGVLLAVIADPQARFTLHSKRWLTSSAKRSCHCAVAEICEKGKCG